MTLLIDPVINFASYLHVDDINIRYPQKARNIESPVSQLVVNTITKPNEAFIDVPLTNQLPELRNGCEITSLTMLLNYNGITIDKNYLAKEVKMDSTPLVLDLSGNILTWGDPNDGFVGDMIGYNADGYSIYPKALLPLVNKYMNNAGKDLTGVTIDTLKNYLIHKKPILVWVTYDFSIPDNFITWTKNGKIIKATFDQHCILLTGYDESNFYYNDPMDSEKNLAIDIETFEEVWNSMGNLALSYD